MSKTRIFLYTTIVSIILVKLFNVVFNKIVTVNLTQNDFSEYLMVLNAVVMITGLSALGISTSLTRYIVHYDSKNSKTEAIDLISTTIIYTNLFQTVICGILFIGANMGLVLFQNTNYIYLLMLIIISSYIQLLIGIMKIISYARSDSFVFFCLTVWPSFFLLAFTVILAFEGITGSYELIYANIAANALIMVLFFIILIKNYGVGKLSFRMFKDSLKLAGPLVIVGQFETISHFFLLTLLYSFYPKEVAIYSIGLSIANLIQLVRQVIPTTYTPLVVKYYEAEKHQYLNYFVNKISKIYFSFSIPFLLVIYAFSPLLILLLSTKEYLLGTIVVLFFSATNLIQTGRYITTFGHLVKMRTDKIALADIIAIIAKIVIGLILIPELGMAGLALTILLNNLITFIGEFLVSQKLYKICYQSQIYIKISILALITFILALVLYHMFQIPFELSLFSSTLFFIIGIILLKIITVDDLYFIKFILFKGERENHVSPQNYK